MKKLFIWFFLFTIKLSAQTISGTVSYQNEKGKTETVAGATVYFQTKNNPVITDSVGNFSIALPDSLPINLITTMSGFVSDSLLITGKERKTLQIILKPIVELTQVEVAEKQDATLIKRFTPINTEVIGNKELQKAACCNLSESFSTNGSVDVAFTDAVSGAKKIQMLGLDGIYTQMLSENIPFLRGLSAAYGLNFIPGTWIESIAVTKGTGSVVNGYEGITGQINLEFLKPKEQKKRLFINLYVNHKSRLEANLHYTPKLKNKNWATTLFLHSSDLSQKNDMNSDTFLDMPLYRQYNIFNRWDFFNQKNIEAQFGIRAMSERKQAGQTFFKGAFNDTVSKAYGIAINTDVLEYFSKTGFLFKSSPYKSIGIQTSGKMQNQEMFFGRKKYLGQQEYFYLNAIYANIIGTTNHKYKAGLSYMYDNYHQSYNDSLFHRTEQVPGVFAEYTFSHPDNFSLVAGFRIDKNNLYGWYYTPRIHLRYNPSKNATWRASAGRGYRTANVFVENQSVLASSRKIVVDDNLLPEIAWNWGVSINQQFVLFNQKGFVNIDFFRTDFENQIVVDLDKNVHEVHFYNLQGVSYSNSLQADLAFSPIENLDIKATYKFLDVKTNYGKELLAKPFVAKHRWMLNMAYATFKEVWKIDFTTRWYGQGRMPSANQNNAEFQWQNNTKSFFILQAQITKKFRKFIAYLGCENLLNYMQPNAIIDAQSPFSNYFDASLIYGPMDGRIIYTGIRLEIK
jgi:outer membrane receptor for ferrienterochelin and colicins